MVFLRKHPVCIAMDRNDSFPTLYDSFPTARKKWPHPISIRQGGSRFASVIQIRPREGPHVNIAFVSEFHSWQEFTRIRFGAMDTLRDLQISGLQCWVAGYGSNSHINFPAVKIITSGKLHPPGARRKYFAAETKYFQAFSLDLRGPL